MPRQRFAREQIIGKSREVEVAVAKWVTVAEACRGIEVREQLLYRWCKEYGGPKVNQARHMKELDAECPPSAPKQNAWAVAGAGRIADFGYEVSVVAEEGFEPPTQGL